MLHSYTDTLIYFLADIFVPIYNECFIHAQRHYAIAWLIEFCTNNQCFISRDIALLPG